MIAVTGSTGALGGLVARSLAGSDFRLDLRLLVRDPARAPDIDCDVRVCEYADEEAAVAALRGVDTLFMVSASEAEDRRDAAPHVHPGGRRGRGSGTSSTPRSPAPRRTRRSPSGGTTTTPRSRSGRAG